MPEVHPKRKIARLKDYDYTQPGGYFITICTYHHAPLFGSVREGQMALNSPGQAVEWCWQKLPSSYPNIVLDAFAVLPNHVHGILIIEEEGQISLSEVVRRFKRSATERIRRMFQSDPGPIWQRGFYDRIIRNDRELERLRNYVYYNAVKYEMSHPE